MLHHNFVSVLLNDLYGIQARGGCACAGPYAQVSNNKYQMRNLVLLTEFIKRFSLDCHEIKTAARVFSPGTAPVFPPFSKLLFLNSNSTWNLRATGLSVTNDC